MRADPHTRRHFLQGLAAASAAAMATGEPRALRANTIAGPPKGTADACILIWMAGGMAAPETLDPKRYTPFKVGTPVDTILSTFPSIPTVLDGV